MKYFDSVIKYLTKYMRRNKDYKVPYDYVTMSGFPLGRFVDNIRFHSDLLSKEEKDQLVKTGFQIERTGKSYKFDFHEVYDRLKVYKKNNVNLAVTKDYVDTDGFPLGEKVRQIRQGYVVLSGAQDEDLDSIDFVWEEPAVKNEIKQIEQPKKNIRIITFNFQEYFDHLKEYEQKFHDMFVPVAYKSEDGYTLGSKTSNIRNNSVRLSDEQKQILTDNGFLWELPEDKKHGNKTFDLKKYVYEAQKYLAEHGENGIPSEYVTPEGYKLGERTSYVKRFERYKKRIEKEYPDFDFSKTYITSGRKKTKFNDFDNTYEKLLEYKNKFGHLTVEVKYQCADGFPLGKKAQQLRRWKQELSSAQLKQLNDIEFVWTKSQFDFEKFFSELEKYKDKKGDLHISSKYATPDNYTLGVRVANLRSGKIHLKPEQIEKLNKIGFVWHVEKFDFDKFYSELELYSKEYHTAQVPRNYVTKEGYKLGKKVDSIRSGMTHLSDREKQKLTDFGFKWKLKEKRFNFEEFLENLREYKKSNKNAMVPAEYVTQNGYKLGRKVFDVKSGHLIITLNQKTLLESEGITFGQAWQRRFENGFKKIKKQSELNETEEME